MSWFKKVLMGLPLLVFCTLSFGQRNLIDFNSAKALELNVRGLITIENFTTVITPISDLLYLDMSNVSVGANGSEWVDDINNITLSQATESLRPTYYNYNDTAAWYFDDTDDYLSGSSIGIGTGDFTMSGSVVWSDKSQNDMFGQYLDGNNYWRVLQNGTELAYASKIGGVTEVWQADGNLNDSTRYIYSIVFDRDVGCKIYINGEEKTLSVDFGSNTDDLDVGAFRVGNILTGSDSYQDNIRVFSRVLTNEERELVEAEITKNVYPGFVTVAVLSGQSNIDWSNNTVADSLPSEYEGDLPAKIFDGTEFVTLNTSVSNNNQYPYPAGGWAWETPLAKEYYDINNDSLYIIKFAVGGKALAVDVATTDYNVTSGELYDSVINVINRADTWLTNNLGANNYKIKYMAWHQGERDMSDNSFALAYDDNFPDFFDSVRANTNTPFMEILGIRPNPTAYAQADIDSVRRVFTSSFNGLSNYNLVDIDDYSLNPSDQVHIIAPEQVRLGKRMANDFIVLDF